MDKSIGKSVLFCVATAVVVTALAVTLGILSAELAERKNQLEGLYQKSYYEVMDRLNGIEESLAKLEVSTDARTQSKLLSQVSTDSQVVESELSSLMNATPDESEVISFINKLGDFSKSLAEGKKDGVTEESRAILAKLYNIVVRLKSGLESVKSELIGGSKLVGRLGTKLNFVGEGLESVNFSTIEVPELIYDGPFSDALNDKELKFLRDATDMTIEEVAQKIREVFPDAAFSHEQEGEIPSYVFSTDGGDGSLIVTKKGGYAYQYNRYAEVSDSALEEDEYIERAQKFLTDLGYADMTAVWLSNNNSTVYVNFAYQKDGVICYPDLMVVKLSGDDGSVLGLDGQNYIFNHTERVFGEAKPEAEAEASLSPSVSVINVRLSLIPTDWNEEILAYEYECSYRDDVYYIYVDAATLEEIRILRVIDDEGRLLA